MANQQHNQYLESKVLTSSADKLHLMLIEGALRFGRKAEHALDQDNPTAANDLLLRTIDIVGEMLVGVRGSESELNSKLAELYLFIFRRLAEAKVNADCDKLREALRILEYERETWQIACEKQDAANALADGASSPKRWRSDQVPTSPVNRIETPQPNADTGVSFEA